MSNYYKFLKLPKNPLSSDWTPYKIFWLTKKGKEGMYGKEVNDGLSPEDRLNSYKYQILNDETINALRPYGFDDAYLTYFGMGKRRTIKDALLHHDILLVNYEWRPVSYAINWELTEYNTIFSWWKTDSQAMYPQTNLLDNPHGVHYGVRGFGSNVKEGDQLLDSVCTNSGPLMVRTDVPHAIFCDHEIQNLPRYALSLRFPDATRISWEEGVKKFQDLLV